ncbi:uncharacterized protein LOC125884330 [Epinephelus fuscoguttatus]|uniref:uncharacterized protein LOC125884330 n=1 Tax=Epinephelus fuscoguttatus TaxID=293821 RepID=UPI0020CFFAE5|nr:uncharacterized protein LOC125884330 [Epinephelus fuscoguttatus]
MNGSQYIWILIGHLLQNVALNKKAVQSSVGFGDAARAVDGNKDPRLTSKTCIHTKEESDPWWRVDLQNVYKIAAVTITNRKEHSHRLNGAEIWIKNSIETNDTKSIRCAVISHIPSEQTVYFPCSAAEGRYVMVLVRGSKKVLSLCEVEVFPENYAHPLSNVALKGDATQSSTLSSATASKAIDGRRNSYYSQGSCSHTAEKKTNPWWRVDLRRTYIVNSVKITNRRDCCAERLDGAEIRIGNSLENNGNSNPRCATIAHIRAGKTNTYYCDGGSMEGRFVNVIIPGEGKTLTLCEVEVFPENYVHPLSNVALKGDATQSSTLSFATASKAIDGRRNSYYSQGFCSHTAEKKTNPWWRVDLRRTYIVNSVKITNRGDCCAERLDGAEIRIGNSLENNGNGNPRCATIAHIRAGKTNTYHCDGGSMEGRFVNVIIPGEGKTLTLCEVEVYAAPKAVSGCRGGIVDRCCSQTLEQYEPWWRVDLLAVHKVSAITIINRRDCCTDKLRGAQIRIGNTPSTYGFINPRCGTISSTDDTSMYTFDCAGMKGRYIKVIIPGDSKVLTLCEVEVFASAVITPSPPLPPPPPPPAVSVLLSGRNVTVVGERLCWADALFFCRRHHWDLLSLRSQEEQSEVEQLLSRSPFPLTDYVWLGLRRYLMGDRWFWMSGDSMKFTKWRRDSAPNRYSSPCGGMARGELFLWEDQPCGKHLNFICQSGAESGTQRVYFYSTRKAADP